MDSTPTRNGVIVDGETPPGAGRFTIRIDGMTCAACSSRVQRTLNKMSGVRSASVNLATHLATVEADPGLDVHDLERCVQDAGYGAAAVRHEDLLREAAREPDTKPALRRLVLGATAGLPLMILGMSHVHGSFAMGAQALLAFVGSYVAGFSIHAAALKRMIHGETTMDTLVSLGATAAFAYSMFVWISRPDQPVYFETAGGIVVFILLGRYLEAKSKARAASGLRALHAMQPTSASLVHEGSESEVPVEVVRSGDTILVRPGERIPLDGTITEGTTSTDESMLTGESMPVDRKPSDPVFGGTINRQGAIKVVVTAGASESALARITRLVADAQGSRAPLQRVADRVSAWFVPSILVVSLATFVAWMFILDVTVTEAIMVSVSVLVIACPCALGLATPTAVMVGVARAARAGVLVRDAAGLERAAAVNIVVFDKTGTLTEGRPRLASVRVRENVDENEVLTLAASLATSSEHPLGKALVDEARRRKLSLRSPGDVVAEAGIGMVGRVGDQALSVRAADGPVPDLEDAANEARVRGESVSVVACDGDIIGLVTFVDQLREDAADSLERLRALGVRPVLATGDHANVAASLAQAVGIAPTDVHARQLPEDKVRLVEELRRVGVVAMAGDGVNDAPALAAADVGVAMGSGTDVANEAAAITLSRSDIVSLVASLEIARATVRTIHQNLGWALGYNLVAVPLAAFGLLTQFGGPMLAAGAMALSSVSVVLNSLRLGRAVART